MQHGARRWVAEGRRLGETLWHGLSTWGRLSALGLVGAAILAIGLGWYIPRQVWRQVLTSEIDTDRKVIAGLLGTEQMVDERGLVDLQRLDALVRQAVLTGDYVRAKLWASDGTIVYSDEPRLIGMRFPLDDSLEAAFDGHSTSAPSDLDADENRFEQEFGAELLETYIPVEIGGQAYTWEVYRSLDQLDSSVGAVRRAVWISVGTGLGALLLFLSSGWGGVLGLAERRRAEAEQRSRELGTLLEVTDAVSAPITSTARLAEESVHAVRHAGGFRSVTLVDSSSSEPVVLASSRDDDCQTTCQAWGTGQPRDSCASVEVGIDEGVQLVACRAVEVGFTDAERALLSAVARQIGSALERARLYEDLLRSRETQRRLTAQLVTAHEDERKHIVGEIHDGIGQDLHRVLFGLRGCRTGTVEEILPELERIQEVTEGAVRQLRDTLQTLHPPALERIGLTAAVRGLADRVHVRDGLHVTLDLEQVDPLPMLVRTAAFRIIQEGLANVTKHAETAEAQVRISRTETALHVAVSDEGRGGAGPAAGEGLGLWLMQQRAESLGGTVELDTSGDRGARLRVEIPLEVDG